MKKVPPNNPSSDDLHELLKPYVVGSTLRHPLVFSELVNKATIPRINHLFTLRQRQYDELLSEGRLESLVHLHQPYARLMAFQSSHWERDQEYYRILGNAWNAPDVLFQPSGELWGLLGIDDIHRAVMTEQEYDAFHSLPAEVSIYRGTRRGLEIAPSWTLDKTIARRYSDVYGREGVLIRTTLFRSDVIAYFLRRGEFEIVPFSSSLRRANVLPG